MSKGLGKIQQGIIDILQERGHWAPAREVIADLFAVIGDGTNEISYSFYTSALRAIVGLEKRRLLHTSKQQTAAWHSDSRSYHRLAVWLPGQSAPDTERTLTGAQIESLLLSKLRSFTEDEAKNSFSCPFSPRKKEIAGLHNHPLDVRYEILAGEVLKVIGQTNTCRVAVSRAVRRLADKRAVHTILLRGQVVIVRQLEID
jgi:hypothetical protein